MSFSRHVLCSRGPCQVVTTDFDIVICEFTKLVVIHTEELSLFRRTEVETGDLVNDKGNDGADNERVSGAGADVSELHIQLLVVVGDPATWVESSVHAVETDDVVCSENTVCEETKHAGDTVLSEHVHCVVDSDPVFD